MTRAYSICPVTGRGHVGAHVPAVQTSDERQVRMHVEIGHFRSQFAPRLRKNKADSGNVLYSACVRQWGPNRCRGIRHLVARLANPAVLADTIDGDADTRSIYRSYRSKK